MLRIPLSDPHRAELHALRRTELPAVARDRREMVLLSAAGSPPTWAATHLGRHPHTVRAAIHGFAARGTKAFYPDAPDPNYARRAQVAGRLTNLLGQDRTWTRRPLAEGLGPAIGIGHPQTRRHLALLKAGDRRTAQTSATGTTPRRSGRPSGFSTA